jgi:hypothetical protein
VPAQQQLIAGVNQLVLRADSIEDLRSHRLHLLGAPVRPSPEYAGEERMAMAAALVAPSLLERVRQASDEPILLMKGPEAAAFYPNPHVRVFHDLDLLVRDPQETQRRLLEAGFQEVGDPEIFADIHHERPLWWPHSAMIVIELHSRPKWLDGLEPPSFDELLASAVPSATGAEGILAPSPAHHALLLAVHTWAHVPLGRLLDLVDVAAVAQQADEAEIRAVAERWGIGRLWKTTRGVIDSLFYGGSRTWAERLWARNLQGASERTVLETHLERWLSPYWGLPFDKAVRASLAAVAAEVEPAEGETWGEKWRRIRRAVRNAFVSRAEHARQLGPAGDLRKRKR